MGKLTLDYASDYVGDENIVLGFTDCNGDSIILGDDTLEAGLVNVVFESQNNPDARSGCVWLKSKEARKLGKRLITLANLAAISKVGA